MRIRVPKWVKYGVGGYLAVGAAFALKMQSQEAQLDQLARRSGALVYPRQGQMGMFVKRMLGWPLGFLGGAR